jgi:uroporphyrinogen-III decarboxylase
LECHLGNPFFDFYAMSRVGGLEQAIFDLMDRKDHFTGLQERYIAHMVAKVEAICRQSTVESFFLGCSWSCVSCIGPSLWRRWDAPVIRAIAQAVHRHGRLLHLHFHGRSLAVLADLAELGCDCICPFERGPGGDIDGLAGLRKVRAALGERTTMNGNVHTVETLIRGRPEDARREVDEILTAFAGSRRFIIGTGDQVGGETPEENLHAMIERAKGR